MEIVRSLLVRQVKTEPQTFLLTLGYDDYLVMIEVSLSLAVFLGSLAYGIRAYFRRREAKNIKEVANDKKEIEETPVPEEKIEEKSTEKGEESEIEEIDMMQNNLGGIHVIRLVQLETNEDDKDDDEDVSETEETTDQEGAEEEETDQEEDREVRRIVEAIEKISEGDGQILGQAVWEVDTTEEDKESDDEDMKEEKYEEHSEVPDKDKVHPEEVMQVRRQASLTMRKPFVVYYNPHRPIPPIDKRATVKRSSSQGSGPGANSTVATATRNPRVNARGRSKERNGETDASAAE